MSIINILLIFLLLISKFNELLSVNITIWGPGLKPKIVLPARYFYVKYNQDRLVRK